MRPLKWLWAALRGEPCPHTLYPAMLDEIENGRKRPASVPCARARYHPGFHGRGDFVWANDNDPVV